MGMLRGGFDVLAATRRSRSRSIRARSAPTPSPSSAELGFNRISVGIQDFDPAVQEAVNRIQTEAETMTVIDAARANGFVSVNADLIYGLPQADGGRILGDARQGDRGRARPHRALQLRARAASVQAAAAHRHRRACRRRRPSSRSSRWRSRSSAPPATSTSAWTTSPSRPTSSPSRRRSASCIATSRATRPSPTATCWRSASRRSARSARRTSPTCKTLDEYYERLDANELPVMRGVELNADDLLRRDVIQKLMCNFELDFAAVGAEYGIRVRRLLRPGSRGARAARRRRPGRARRARGAR